MPASRFWEPYLGSVGRFFEGDPTLVRYWQLNGKTYDNSGNGYHGTIENTPRVYHTNAVNQFFAPTCYAFDRADNDRINFTTASYGISNQYSIGGWGKPRNYLGANLYMFAFGGGFNGIGWGFQTDASGNYFFQGYHTDVYISTDYGAKWQKTPILNRWYFWTHTWNGSICKLYIDGILVSTNNAPNIASGRTQPSYIGAWEGGAHCWEGEISEVFVFNRELTSQEIYQYYQWATSSPKKYWYFGVSGINPAIFRRRLLLK